MKKLHNLIDNFYSSKNKLCFWVRGYYALPAAKYTPTWQRAVLYLFSGHLKTDRKHLTSVAVSLLAGVAEHRIAKSPGL